MSNCFLADAVKDVTVYRKETCQRV